MRQDVYFDGEIEVDLEDDDFGPSQMTFYLSGSKADRETVVSKLVTAFGNMREAQTEKARAS